MQHRCIVNIKNSIVLLLIEQKCYGVLFLYAYRSYDLRLYLYHYGKNQNKVLGRKFEGDSPQCGEMSEGQRGPPLLAEPYLKRVSLNKLPINLP